MKKIAIPFIGLATIVVFNSGCAMYQARFSPPVAHVTAIRLNQNNFHLIERNVEGSYGCFSLQLGFYPIASLEIPLADPRLFSKALADMYSKSQGMAEGKTVQFVNWTLDANAWWIPIPWITPAVRKATFRADLLEFTR